MTLRLSVAVLLALIFLTMIALPSTVLAQTYIEYKIQLNQDGSALWTITQVSGINGTTDTWLGFEQKTSTLVNSAANQTHRLMSLDLSSLQMTTNITSTNTKTAQYMFIWQNFSKINNNQLIIGDVFAVPGFFNFLYGDGRLQITYPQGWIIKTVTPMPDERDDSTQTLQWLGTQYFITGKPSIVLSSQQSNGRFQQQTYLIVGVILGIVIIAVAGSFFFLNRRKKSSNIETKGGSQNVLTIETEEEKILRVLRSNGGSAYQSVITEQCHFSKAKTSQLLSKLEANGVVRRVKKGRDKIVNLIEPNERGK